jgi:hypothetical protein
MRVVFAVVAISFLSTSVYATECHKLRWAERGECYRSDPAFPVRYDMCRDMVEERGYKGAGLKGKRRFFNGCMRELSPLNINELTRTTRLFGVEVVAWRPKRTANAQ